MAKTDDTQVIEPTAVNAPTPFVRWKENIEARARQANKDGSRASGIMQDQANAILSANTLEEALEADDGGLVNGKSMVNVPLKIYGYELAESGDEFKGGDVDVYVNMDCAVLASGESEYSPGDKVVINVGGLLVVTKLEMIRSFDAFPFDGILRPAGRALKLKPYKSPTVTQ